MQKKTMREKLESLQEMVVDEYIKAIAIGDLHPRDMAPVITLLNHNKVVTKAEQEEGQHSKIKKIMKKKETSNG